MPVTCSGLYNFWNEAYVQTKRERGGGGGVAGWGSGVRVRRGGEGLIGTLLSIIIHCPVLFQVPRGARKFGWGRAYNQNILFISRQIGHISLTGLIISGRGMGRTGQAGVGQMLLTHYQIIIFLKKYWTSSASEIFVFITLWINGTCLKCPSWVGS